MKNVDCYPVYSVRERVADGAIHLFGLAFALVGFVVLLVMSFLQHAAHETLTLAIYGLAMMLMLACSAAYNMVPLIEWKALLRRFDQAAIFIKIAGTYTPFAFLKMGGLMGFGLLGTVWLIALMGAGMVLGMKKRHKKLTIVLYLALGWAGVLLLGPLMMSMSTLAFVLLGAGGVLYSLGVIFHLWSSLPFSNAIWHLFVLVATICHYFAVFVAVLLER